MYLRLEFLKIFRNGIVLVLVLNFESFCCDLLTSVSFFNKMDAKVSIKTQTKTIPVQNIFRYKSF